MSHGLCWSPSAETDITKVLISAHSGFFLVPCCFCTVFCTYGSACSCVRHDIVCRHKAGKLGAVCSGDLSQCTWTWLFDSRIFSVLTAFLGVVPRPRPLGWLASKAYLSFIWYRSFFYVARDPENIQCTSQYVRPFWRHSAANNAVRIS